MWAYFSDWLKPPTRIYSILFTNNKRLPGKGICFQVSHVRLPGKPCDYRMERWNGCFCKRAYVITLIEKTTFDNPPSSHQACIPLQTNIRMWYGRFPTKFILHQYPSYLHVQDIDREFSCTVYTQFWMQHWCYSKYLSHTRLNANMFTYVSVYSSIHDWCIWSLPTSFMLLTGHPCSHKAIWLSILSGQIIVPSSPWLGIPPFLVVKRNLPESHSKRPDHSGLGIIV